MINLTHLPASELAWLIRRRDVSSVEVVQAYLDRIADLNPRINAVTLVMPDALERARKADDALATGNADGPLLGVPFTVKDIFETVGMVSPLDRGLRNRAIPKHDASVVERLRNAGAILIAKTNCPPNGGGVDTENTVTGRTLNPYNLTATPGGSSGGEAALIAAGGSPIGLGSDQNGGLRLPAHYCGVVSIKPTSGRVPNSGAYNQPGGLTDPRTQIGPIARSVADLELILPIISGPDDYDSGVVPVPWQDPKFIHPENLTIACFNEDPASSVTPEVRAAVSMAAQVLNRAGAEIENIVPKDFVRQSHEIDDLWQNMAGTNGRTTVEVYALWDDLRTRMLYFMAKYDAILCPVSHQPAPAFRERDSRRFDYTIPFSLTGYPAAVVRVGTSTSGLPIGVQIVAPPWREDIVLALARILEQAFGGWKAPVL